jgi:hypothetical protein
MISALVPTLRPGQLGGDHKGILWRAEAQPVLKLIALLVDRAQIGRISEGAEGV